ncbi:kinase-like domain-containing protein [Flagelloscypha sp. PMI_526]|nr:kinase-like domain-containing protein [Flagelloscypha sp. PMI_526]
MEPTTQPILARNLPPLINETIASGQLLLCKELGSGTYGCVYLAKDVSTGNFFAVKCIPKTDSKGVKEYRLHEAVSWSEHISTIHCIFDDLGMTFIVLDYYAGGDLFGLLQTETLKSKSFLIREMFLQIAQGVVDMHICGIYHRDIKPENVLISETGTLHLCDFGLATDNPEPNEYKVGTTEYMSPECLQGTAANTNYPQHDDVWALGVILFNLVTGGNPWDKAAYSDKLYDTFVADPELFLKVYPQLTPEFNTLLKKLFHPDFRTWMNAAQLMREVEDISLFFVVFIQEAVSDGSDDEFEPLTPEALELSDVVPGSSSTSATKNQWSI